MMKLELKLKGLKKTFDLLYYDKLECKEDYGSLLFRTKDNKYISIYRGEGVHITIYNIDTNEFEFDEYTLKNDFKAKLIIDVL